ncbi:MAG: nucleotidyltransferase domain-containing protein [Thermoanaerobaculia bacterium]|nr:nucleotidyltransferase domain-containing protein [Thermoanaerobaculia bacterium]
MRDLEAIKTELEAQPSVLLAVLFGSVARGRSGPQSDLDLGVQLDPDTPQERRRIEVLAARATRRQTDVVFLDDAPPLLRFQIARDGRVLVEHQPRAWPRFKEKAMTDWWDWAPTARKINAIYLRRLKEQVAHGGS